MGELLQVQPIFVCFSYRITRLHYTYRCPTLKAAYVCKLYLQNHWGKLQLQLSNVTFSLLLCAPPIEKLGFTTLMGSPSYVRLTLVTSILKITGLHYSYGCATLSAAYVGYLQFQNHLLTPHLWVYNVKLSLLLLASITETLGCTTLMGASSYVRLTLVASSQRITGLHYSYGCATLSRAYVGYLFSAAYVDYLQFQNHLLKVHIWVSNLKCSLCLYVLNVA